MFRSRATPSLAALAVAVFAMPVTGQQRQARHLSYPVTAKGNVVDDYFGREVPAPYRWMEDLGSPEVAAWEKEEQAVTERYLSSLPLRQRFRNRITELWNYPKVTLPFRVGGRLFYGKNSGLQRQFAYYSRSQPEGAESLVLDPNTLWPDGTLALSGFSPSPDGRFVAYGVAEGGADWRIIHLRDLASGRELSDTVRWLKGGGTSWTRDGNGFFYSRFPTPEPGKQLQNAIRDEKIYYHRIGTPQSEDPLIYERPEQPEWFVNGRVSQDGRYLFVAVNRGTESQNRLYLADLGDPLHPNISAPIRPLFDKGDASYVPIGNVGSTVYLETDLQAPRRRIVAFDAARPDTGAWHTIVAEAPSAIAEVALMQGRIAVNYLEDVKAKVRLFTWDGAPAGELALPGIGTLAGMSARADAPDLFYAFTSPLYPTTIFRYDPATGRSSAFEPATLTFDRSGYETKQLFATSKDGTRVPIFITMKKGMALDGTHPTMLYGYGGFDISETPSFQPDVPAWLERGGIWVTANMRGGAEYGEAWHHAGMFEKKQNVFDDFIAAAEYLVKHHYTTPRRLGIKGASNGGLLVGAVEEQRPDLFAVALPAVGVMDMLRYHKFTGGGAWATEYGSSADSTAFQYLIRYSPVQNVKAGTCYPATLVTTADHDDRVVPSHSFKFTAAMQAAQGCAHPVLIRIETGGSHGYRPTDKRIAELADEWAFAAANMGLSGR